ncbi:aminotransferase class I/II-fold pyridoxal phosphate-dependent enzyme [Gemmatimonas sp.]|uniref:pyridoxal phosphate-dependent decarboxylase family protein n=1 Tax=Gemmatimonas sp. TaxID=1962908 RepID=UPI0025C73085|nr:aminotransferase class I/II-fold pyridoxal phosphate-dependent enzyme [Gemmatimonas sp.]MCA2990525.1 aminotransferase class I/II-fold pyridoxal phosphate-dependent enzyme [Gemmatimonas sp.]
MSHAMSHDPSSPPRAPLQLSRAEMQALGDQALAMVIAHHEGIREQPTTTTMSRAEAAARLYTPLPEAPTPPTELLAQLARDVFPNAFRADHPRFYAFVPSPSNFVSAVGDFLTSGHNVFSGHWLASSGASQIELTVLDWLQRACGLPPEAGGIFVSGGSMANLSAVVVARETRLGGHDPRAVVYYSDQTHSSMSKGLRVLGFGKAQRRMVTTDAKFRLSLPALEEAIRTDRANGMRPFCVVANAGTTNTGAVDPLHALADLCAREGLWLHIDGAYGAAAVLHPRGAAALEGLGRADSITLDPHKWLFQPFEIGCLLVRDAQLMQDAFRVEDEDHADYLADITRHIQQDVNFFERGIQLTRSFKALKLWLSLRTFGLAAFRDAIQVGFDVADFAQQWLEASGRWEIVTPSQLGIVTFRWRGAGLDDAAVDALTGRVVDRLRADGYATVMSTLLRGRPALRLCPIHWDATTREMAVTLERLTRFALEESARA